MGKARNGGQKSGKPQTAKAIKEGQVQKKKALPAFIQTPKGKYAFVKEAGNLNSQKTRLGKAPLQSKAQANAGNKKQNNMNPKMNSPTKQLAQKKKKNNSKAALLAAAEESDSDEDINEEVSITEQVSVGEDDDDSSDEETVPNILGDSLADESDDDDDDFEADSEEEEVNKGVKMFKGIKSTSKNSSLEDMDEDDDEDEDDDDDDDDDDEDEDGASASVTASSSNTSGDNSSTMDVSIANDNDDEDEDDDDDDDDDESPGLKALLGKSLVDDEDDEDFNDEEGEEDDDDDIDDSEEDEEDESQSDKNVNTVSTSQEEKKLLTPEEKAEKDSRTIYIGNVPKDVKEARIKSEFRKYGIIETLRVRGVVPDSPKKSYKVATIKKQIHAKVTSICVFIVYKTEESAKAALAMNGKLFDGNYLRVDRANQNKEYDNKKNSIFGKCTV